MGDRIGPEHAPGRLNSIKKVTPQRGWFSDILKLGRALR